MNSKRRTMEILTCVLSAISILLAPVRNAEADFTFGEPENLGPPVNSASHEGVFCISANELELYFTSMRPNGYGGWDIWFTSRASKEAEWNQPVTLGANVNSTFNTGSVVVSPDGLELYCEAPPNWEEGYGSVDIWVCRRATAVDPWGPAINLGPTINSAADEVCYCMSSDGLELYFADGFVAAPRPGGQGGRDIWVTRRESLSDPWKVPVNIGAPVNTSANEYAPFISADGLALFFTSHGAPGSGIDDDIWITTRASLSDPWRVPCRLAPPVNLGGWADAVPRVSLDGLTMYFYSSRPGGYGGGDIWQASIEPVVDFNGDGLIDLVDLVMLIDNWGTDDTLYDIGPMPWGDGTVDVEDLKVFIVEWEKQNTPNSDGPE